MRNAILTFALATAILLHHLPVTAQSSSSNSSNPDMVEFTKHVKRHLESMGYNFDIDECIFMVRGVCPMIPITRGVVRIYVEPTRICIFRGYMSSEEKNYVGGFQIGTGREISYEHCTL